jgi:hypothetical protein
VRSVRRRDQQPRQQRVVDKPDAIAVTPRFKKNDGDSIVSIGGRRDKTCDVTHQTRRVTVEDTTKRTTITRYG